MSFHFQIHEPPIVHMKKIKKFPDPGYNLVEFSPFFILFLNVQQTFLILILPDILFYKISEVGSLFVFCKVTKVFFF